MFNFTELVKKILKEDEDTAKTKAEFKKLLKLDELNYLYFLNLLKKYYAFKKEKKLYIFDEQKRKKLPDDTVFVYPTAIANKEMLENLSLVNYKDISNTNEGAYEKHAVNVKLWLKKMQAGTGSSLIRTKYLANLLGTDEKNVKIGSKGTDLFIDYNGVPISLVELQIIQTILEIKKQKIGSVIFNDIVSSETEKAVDAVWNKKSVLDKNLTYSELLNQDEKLKRHTASIQAFLPTIDENNELSVNRKSPGGHGLFGVEALLAATDKNLRPENNSTLSLIASVSNGEDTCASPDASMLGWMQKEKIPIAIVLTEKTEIDLKGGQISVVKDENGYYYSTIIEKAQAEATEQLALFESLGLRDQDNVAFFNTNMLMFNYEVLSPLFEALLQKISLNEFMSIISPDLILNKKKQKESNGEIKSYIQLEGAIASSVLNIDKYWRKNFKKALVHYIIVDKIDRTKFFSPIKTAFDFFMQFYSDRFTLDKSTMKLVDNRKGLLPSVEFFDNFYDDLKNVLNVFKNTKILNLDSLSVKGLVDFTDTTLIGNVKVRNNSSKILKLKEIGYKYIENQNIEI